MHLPNKIFKYFTEERVDVLEHGLIRYTQPKDFNDPFELLPNFKSIASHDLIETQVDNFNKTSEQYEEILFEQLESMPQFKILSAEQKETFKLIALENLYEKLPTLLPEMKNLFLSCLKLEGENKEPMIEMVTNSINNVIGILCFTEKHDNLLMWSHYTNSHKGFVLEFFPNHEYFDRRKNNGQFAEHLKKVNYTKSRPEFVFYDSNFSEQQNIDNWVKNLIWAKSCHWEYEEEWRIISIIKDSYKSLNFESQNIHLYKIPPSTIKSIYLGCKMEESTINKIKSLIRKNHRISHVKLFQSIQDETDYKLNFVEQKI